MKQLESSSYINEQRRSYSLYVMQMRAIPAVTDGLKAGGRRVLWTARDGKKFKSAALAGATMPLHPHASPEGSIDTLAAPYGNNIPLFQGHGAFGTLLNPTAYGASRYTSVTVSKFTQDVVFRDIEIIPMQANYDETLQEPVHFIPLIPIVLLNSTEGIAVGFATNILPRSLEDIIVAQITHLQGGKVLSQLFPKFAPTKNFAYKHEETERGQAYYFEGEIEKVDGVTIRITKLPYGVKHESIVEKLDDLSSNGTVIDYKDSSKDKINITVKFKKGTLHGLSPQEIMQLVGLQVRHIENLNVLDFTGKTIWNTEPVELIRKFTDWRLTFYPKRYQRLVDLLNKDIQRYQDIIVAIDNNVGGAAKKIKDKEQLKQHLIKINIVDVDYIASLPVYRFTEQEYNITKEQFNNALTTKKIYSDIIKDVKKQKEIYVAELQDVLKKYNKGQYSE